MAKYNYFSDSGLAALLNQLKTNKKAAEANTSAVSGLENDFQEMTLQIAGVVDDVAGCLNDLNEMKADNEALENGLADKLGYINGEIAMPSAVQWISIAYGNGVYVAIANWTDVGAYSTDGINWIEMTMPSSSFWKSVTFGEGMFVAIASSALSVAYSTDGVNWSTAASPHAINWSSVAYGNGRFVAVSRSTTTTEYSDDGTTWKISSMPASRNWIAIVYGDDKFVAIAADSTASAYSTDGINWTEMTMPASVTWSSVAYGNGRFVAVANGSDICAYSDDGITWTQGAMPVSTSWISIAYGSGKFVAVSAASGIVAYSDDGITWTQATMPATVEWSFIGYCNNAFIAVAKNSTTAAYSVDGVNWMTDIDAIIQGNEDVTEKIIELVESHADTTPTEGSDKLVTSGAVATALKNASSSHVLEGHVTDQNNPHGVAAHQVPISAETNELLAPANQNVDAALQAVGSGVDLITRALQGESLGCIWSTYKQGEVLQDASIKQGFSSGDGSAPQWNPQVTAASSITWDSDGNITLVNPTTTYLMSIYNQAGMYFTIGSLSAGATLYKTTANTTPWVGEVGQFAGADYYVYDSGFTGLQSVVIGNVYTGRVQDANESAYPDNGWVGDTLYVKVGNYSFPALGGAYTLLASHSVSTAAQLVDFSLSGIDWAAYHEVVVEIYHKSSTYALNVFMNSDSAPSTSDSCGYRQSPPSNSSNMTSTQSGLGMVYNCNGSIRFLVNQNASNTVRASVKSIGSFHGSEGVNTGLKYSAFKKLSLYTYNKVPVGTTVKIYGVK